MPARYKYILLILIAAAAVLVFSKTSQAPQPAKQTIAPSPVAPAPADIATSTISAKISATQLQLPIANALARVTKKPFGIYVTPQNSPVSPEKFTGFHTGIDFETLPSEQNTEVPISAACSGKVLLKKWATGYGGVLIQACKLDGADVTIIYGHLDVASINIAVGQTLSVGDKIGVLGQGFSQQTDGERKHLHFGIHKGAGVNILGYVQNSADLTNWLDPQKYLN